MKKKIFSTLLMGAFFLASMSVFTSCKDYDDDINDLQAQIDKNSKAIEDINTLIQSGSVIKSVTKNSDGVTVLLSNGSSFDITNGKDGATGPQGPAGAAGKDGATWNIGTDGYWYKDGVKTDYYALGSKGETGATGSQGPQGPAGATGPQGPAGADGKYYVPNPETYCFDIYQDGKFVEATDIKFVKEGTITAVMDEDNLTLYGVVDKDGNINEEGIVISLSNSLRALVFQKDNLGRLYVDGVPAIRVASFAYNAQTLDKKDSKDEIAKLANKQTVVNVETEAYYHVNPSNVNEKDLKDLAFAIEKDAEYEVTRAVASSDFDVKAEFAGLEDGIVKVKVSVTGVPATAEHISVVALQATKDNKETVTSDYATVYKKDMADLRIADKKKFEAAPSVDYHFRRAFVGISNVDAEAGIADKAVWPTEDGTDCDVELEYTDQIDLIDYVMAHEIGEQACTAANEKALGLTWKFEIVNNYKIGENQTPQEQFISLDGSVIKSKVFDTTGAAAIGRTPIVRVSLMHGAEAVEIAYIKVKIVKKAAPIINPTVDFELGNVKFECGKDATLKTTVQATNVQLYNPLEMSRDEFHSAYPNFEDAVETGDVGTVEELIETTAGETTHLLQWTLTNDDMWANAGKDIQNVVYYKASDAVFVKITLKAKVEGVNTVYNVTKPDFITEYWDADKTYAKFNVAVPTSTSDDNPDNCVFVNDLNSPFTTTADGIIKLDEAVTDIAFTFCKDMEAVKKIGNIDVTFSVENDGLELYATVKGIKELVATIANGLGAVPNNTVTYNKESDIAKQLLNTKEMFAYYSATGNICEDETKVATIQFDGKDHFQAYFVRPVNIADISKANFIDAVDFGEKGSFIRLEDLIAPSDWRGRAFADYENYWGFYGPFTITADLENAKCDLKNGENPDGTKKIAVPATITLTQEPAGTMGDGDDALTSEYGFITYKNNGTGVDNFNLYIPVVVEYGWGTIVVDNIKVPVAKTIAAAKKN